MDTLKQISSDRLEIRGGGGLVSIFGLPEAEVEYLHSIISKALVGS